MELFPCARRKKPVYSYHTEALFPDEKGEYHMATYWVHLHPTKDGHKPEPVLTTDDPDGQD